MLPRLLLAAFFGVRIISGAVLVQEDSVQIQPVQDSFAPAERWRYTDCGNPDDIIELHSISVEPDPPKPGEDLTITASGYVKETLEEGAYADVLVKLGLIKLVQKRFDICEEARNANQTIQCPVEPGEYTLVQTVALPKEIPPAKFTIAIRAYTVDDEDALCLNLWADFTPHRGRHLW